MRGGAHGAMKPAVRFQSPAQQLPLSVFAQCMPDWTALRWLNAVARQHADEQHFTNCWDLTCRWCPDAISHHPIFALMPGARCQAGLLVCIP